MTTSLSVDDVKAQLGHDAPQDQQQEIGLRIWEQLGDEWVLEDDFTAQLARIAGLEEPWQNHDVTALFASLHSAEYIEVRRITPQLRQVRRNPTRPRFFTFVEQAEADQQAMVIFQQDQKAKELERAEAARQELAAPQRQAEAEDLREAINSHPLVIGLREEVHDLESEVRFLRSRLALLETKRGGTTEGQ
jgi:hypothetical protein